jgi:hypothetical protein
VSHTVRRLLLLHLNRSVPQAERFFFVEKRFDRSSF